MAKVIQFRIEFDKPDKALVITEQPCSFCKAKVGQPCSTLKWGGEWSAGVRGGKRMSDLHADRYAEFMKLRIIQRGILYRIRG